jgi:hypothetical protein
MRSKETMMMPLFLNAPLRFKSQDYPLVEFRLRYNKALDLLENDLFDESKIQYDENYQNSGVRSATFRKHLQNVVDLIESNFTKTTAIMEVGCGKGDFIDLMLANGFSNLTGFDTTYQGVNPKIEKRYLTDDDVTAAELTILRHTLEHIQNPHQFLNKIRTVKDSKGYIYIEVPCLDWIRDNNAFFDIAYEHVNYFSLGALSALFGNKFLAKGNIFGGKYIFIIAKLSNLSSEFVETYDQGAQWEFIEFNNLFPGFEKKLRKIESKLNGNNYAYIWGAAGKGGTFLHHCKSLAPKIMGSLRFAVDLNPEKIGKYLPSSLVRIASKEEFFEIATNEDLLLISNPIYTEEILRELELAGLSEMEIFPV